MRSPINQGVINSPNSVGAWAEASVWENQAEAFGVGVRIVPMRGAVEVSASTAAIGERTAYQFSSVEVHANESIEVTRYAWAPAPVLETSAQEEITVTRYAWVMFPEAVPQVADSFDDPEKIIAYSVAFPHPANGVARTWNDDSKTKKLRIRAVPMRGSRTARAEVRVIPNSSIGIGRAEGIAESGIVGTGLSVAHSARSSVTGFAVAPGGTTYLESLMEAVGVAQAAFALEPTVASPNGARISYNSGHPVGTSTGSIAVTRTAYYDSSTGVGESDTTLETNRWYTTESWHDNAPGEAISASGGYVWHLHKVKETLQVSGFMLFGPAFYHLIWADGQARPEGVSQATMRHLRWRGVTGEAPLVAISQADNSRWTPSEGTAEAVGTFSSEGTIYRRMQAGAMEVSLTEAAVAVRWARTNGSMLGEAPHAPDLPSHAVRWAGHGAEDVVDAFATALGEGLRVARISARTLNGGADTEASPLRYAAGRGQAVASLQASNVTPPVRIAVMQSVRTAIAEAQDDEAQLVIYHWVWKQGVSTVTGFTQADGLREFFVSPAPLMTGNASTVRTVFKINATADAPDTRLILVGFPDRELLLPAPDREYYVR